MLLLLQRMNRVEEWPPYADRILANPASPPEELYLAAAALFLAPLPLDDSCARQTLQRIVAALKRAQTAHLNLPLDRRAFPELDVNVAYALGMCYERMENRKAAVQVYTDALSRHPRDGELLTARGLARFEADETAALNDFAAAARLGVAAIWPYLVLAGHFLHRGVPGEALRMALSASRQPGPPRARAVAYDAIGIALAELGQPQERVLENFDQALALDPTNDRIRRNRETALSQPQSRRVGRRQFAPAPIKSDNLRRDRGRDLVNRMDSINEELGSRLGGALVGA